MEATKIYYILKGSKITVMRYNDNDYEYIKWNRNRAALCIIAGETCAYTYINKTWRA